MSKKVEKTEEKINDFVDQTANSIESTNDLKKEDKPIINMYKEGEDEKPSTTVPAIENQLLKEIEQERINFYGVYKKKNTVKSLVSALLLFVMLLGWVLPGRLFPNASSTVIFVIALVICALSIFGLTMYNRSFKKSADEGIKKYFNCFYTNSFKYAFDGTKTSDFVGSLDQKLSDDLFNESKLFKDVYKVGSRYFSTFKYGKVDCTISDAACQTQTKRGLQTLFVGKYLTATNNYKGKPIFIYFKGNKRALPPNNLLSFNVVEDNPNYIITGEQEAKKFITTKIRKTLDSIKTNYTLVDLAISIQQGKTYFGFGYEDNLMVIPLERRLDPRPYDQFKNDISLFLELVDVFNSKKENE